jgi:hypothetical protein
MARNLKLERWEGHRYAVILSRGDSKYILEIMHADILDGHYDMIERSIVEDNFSEGFGKSIEVEKFEELEGALYGKALEVAKEWAGFYQIPLNDLAAKTA